MRRPQKSKGDSLFVVQFLMLGAVVLCSSGTDSFASYRNYCISIYAIAPKLEVCPDNDKVTAAADECLDKFNEEVTRVTKNLQGIFVSNRNSSARAQNAKLQNNGGNLNQTDKGFQYLINIAKRIKKDLRLYITTITLPGNPSYGMLASLDIYDILADTKCYRENRQKLEAHIRYVNKKIRELEIADINTKKLNADTNSIQTSLSALDADGFQKSNSEKKPRDQEKGFRKPSSDVSEDPSIKAKKKKKTKKSND